MAVDLVRGRGYFRRRPDPDAGPLRTFVAPLIAGVLLLVILVLAVTNFNVLITARPTRRPTTAAVILPLILLVAGVIGMIVAATIRSPAIPQRYERIGKRTAVRGGRARRVSLIDARATARGCSSGHSAVRAARRERVRRPSSAAIVVSMSSRVVRGLMVQSRSTTRRGAAWS